MLRSLLPVLLLLCLCSCQHLRKLVKANPAELSSFVEHRGEMKRLPPEAPFQYTWSTRDKSARQKAEALRDIYVAPVSLTELRPMMTGKVRGSKRRGLEVSAEAPAVAGEMRQEFSAALQSQPAPRYRLVATPGPSTLVLELAITELNPTSPAMNAVKLAAKIALGPVGSVGGLAVRSSGNIAVEARLRAGSKGPVVYQFADNESDKLTLYSVRDFRPYGHARMAVKEWARQFAETAQNYAGTKVKDASFWTVSPL